MITDHTRGGADTVPVRGRGYDAGPLVNGCTRHLAVGTGGRLLAVAVAIAGIQHRDGAVRSLAVLRWVVERTLA